MSKPTEVGIDALLSRFGTAEYSDAFWKRVNARVKQEQEDFEAEERESAASAHRALQKQYTI